MKIKSKKATTQSASTSASSSHSDAQNIFWKVLPHAFVLLVFLVVSYLFCQPAIDRLGHQHDIVQFNGAMKAIADFNEPDDPLGHLFWTGSMFGGMPTYQIAGTGGGSNFGLSIWYVLSANGAIPPPMQYFLIACLGMYLLSLVLRLHPFIGMIGGFCYAYASGMGVIIAAGHSTKTVSLALVPFVIAAVFLVFRKKYWLGGFSVLMAVSGLVAANHYQIVYYTGIVVGFLVLAFIVDAVRTRAYKHMAASLAILLIASLIGAGMNAVQLFTTEEYSKETIRGGALLSNQASSSVASKTTEEQGGGGRTKKSTGLTKDYATQYSFLPSETFAILTPRIYGGSNGIREFSENSHIAAAFSSMPPQLAQQLGMLQTAYWGGLESSAGPSYMGVVACCLFLIGLFVLPAKDKWWIAVLTALAILMSWGKYLGWFSSLLFAYLPLFNKFRAPSMALVIVQFTMALGAMLTLHQILKTQQTGIKLSITKPLKNATIAIGVLFGVLFLTYFGLGYKGEDIIRLQREIASQPESIKEAVTNAINALVEDRKAMFLNDLLKAVFFAAVFLSLVWLFVKNRIKPLLLLGCTAAIVLMDLLPINYLYLSKTGGNEDAFSDKPLAQSELSIGKADEEIVKDTSWYRVLNLSVSPFNDATTSYYHKSIGGYHAAKLAIYQDLIEYRIGNEMEDLYKRIQNQDATLQAGLAPTQYPVLTMLGTKYIILSNPKTAAEKPYYLTNPRAMGACWLVNKVVFKTNRLDEMNALGKVDVTQTAILNSENQAALPDTAFSTEGHIKLNRDAGNNLYYTYTGTQPGFAVFSEVYYKPGWVVLIDHKPAAYYRTDYALRGMYLPAGEHSIQFRYNSKAYQSGLKLSKTLGNLTRVLFYALLVFYAFKGWNWYKKRPSTGA